MLNDDRWLFQSKTIEDDYFRFFVTRFGVHQFNFNLEIFYLPKLVMVFRTLHNAVIIYQKLLKYLFIIQSVVTINFFLFFFLTVRIKLSIFIDSQISKLYFLDVFFLKLSTAIVWINDHFSYALKMSLTSVEVNSVIS